MQKSFSLFLRQLHLCRKFFKESDILKSLIQDDFEELKNLGLLKRGGDLTHVICRSCDDPHPIPVKCDGEKPYAFCVSDSTRNYLESHEIRTWIFDAQTFLQQMAFKLGMTDQVEVLGVEGMWQVGTFTRDDTHHMCYFFCGKDFGKVVEFIEKQPANFRRYVIVTCKQESAKEVEQELLLIEAKHLADLKSGAMQFNKKVFENQLTSGFRNVYFDEKNGDLFVNGRYITNVTLSTPEFHFTQALWGNFNLPQSHHSLVSHMYKKTRQEYADSESKICHKMKRNIKKEAEKPEIIDQILKSTKNERGENSYIMRNPT